MIADGSSAIVPAQDACPDSERLWINTYPRLDRSRRGWLDGSRPGDVRLHYGQSTSRSVDQSMNSASAGGAEWRNGR